MSHEVILPPPDSRTAGRLIDAHAHPNSDAPLNKIPQELLVMIFKQVLTIHIPFSAASFPAIHYDGNKPVLGALRVITRVCRLWREVAFGTPALWTRVDSRVCRSDELQRLVQRSDLLPITAFLDNAYDDTTHVPTYLSLLRAISSRLHRVDLDISHPMVPPSDIKQLLSFDGSVLRCLTVSCRTTRNLGTGLVRASSIHVLPILLGQANSLEALAIVPSVAWIPANHFPRLTHLYLSFYPAVRAPLRLDILYLLQNTPCLEILHIHRLIDRQGPLVNEIWLPAPLRVELPSLRSLVFTHSVYKSVMGVLDRLSLPQHTLVRLDNLYIPFNSEYPAPIPSGLSRLLDRATTLQLAADNEMLFLVVEGGPSDSGLWLKVRLGANAFWDRWLSGLSTMLPLGNLTSLHIDLYDVFLLAVLSPTTQLSELLVRLEPEKRSRDGIWRWDGALVPHVAALCSMLSQSGPVVCPSLHSLALEWPRHALAVPNDLSVPDVVAMLSTRAGLGHPIRRLVVQAIPPSDCELGPTLRRYHFPKQLSSLAKHVEEYEECADAAVHVCAFKMHEMWNVPGAEKYWRVDENQRSQYTPLWSYDYSFS